MDDEYYMRKALTVASQTDHGILGPRVGAIIVWDGEIKSTGYKDFATNVYKDPLYCDVVLHAERVALYRMNGNARGPTLYTTLEPCIPSKNDFNLCSCSELIARSEIRRVVIGMVDDTNPYINGRGISYLQERGVEVTILRGFEDMIRPLYVNEEQEIKRKMAKGDDLRSERSTWGRRKAANKKRLKEQELQQEIKERLKDAGFG